VLSYDVAADGALSNQQTLISGLSTPDSMCVDARGNLYIGTRTASRWQLPTARASAPFQSRSLKLSHTAAFGGDDGKTLYITAWDTVWRVRNMPIAGQDWTLNQRIACD